MQDSHVRVLDEHVTKELLVVFFGRGHQLGFYVHRSLAQGEPHGDDVLLIAVKSNEPMKMALIVGRLVMFDLAEHPAFTPLTAPLTHHFIETLRGVAVGDRGSRHD